MDGSPLVKGYWLYLTATLLWRNAIQSQNSGHLFLASNDAVMKALRISLRLCDNVTPKGIEESLRRTVQVEIALVDISEFLSTFVCERN